MGTLKSRLMAALLIALMVGSASALASGYYRGGAYYRGGGYYHGGPRWGVGVTLGAPYWGGWGGWGPGYYYPPPYYSYPPYYYPPAVVTVPSGPVTYIEQAQPEPAPSAQAPAAGVWYYCADSQTYYPYVRECPGGWQTVPAQPPPPR